MSSKAKRTGSRYKRQILGVRFAEVEMEAPSGRGMVVELEGGVRLLVPNDQSVPLAAELINRLWELQARGGRR